MAWLTYRGVAPACRGVDPAVGDEPRRRRAVAVGRDVQLDRCAGVDRQDVLELRRSRPPAPGGQDLLEDRPLAGVVDVLEGIEVDGTAPPTSDGRVVGGCGSMSRLETRRPPAASP